MLKKNLQKIEEQRKATPYSVISDIARIAQSKIRKEGDAIGLKLGYRHLLYYLANGADGCTQQDLVRLTRLSAPTVSVSLSRMELAGLITRTVDRRDARSVHVNLTDRGREMNDGLRKIMDEVEDVSTTGLTEGEVAQLNELLLRVLKNVGDEPEECYIV